jgi:uncharacterized membrane protein
VATSIQASRIIANVADDLEGAINRLFPETIGEESATSDPGGLSADESDAIEEGAFASIVESAFDEIARYGRSSVSVTRRLLEAVRSVGSCVQREAGRRALLRQAAEIAGEVRESPFSDGDRERIARCYRATLTALHEPTDDRSSPRVRRYPATH